MLTAYMVSQPYTGKDWHANERAALIGDRPHLAAAAHERDRQAIHSEAFCARIPEP
jgi:hypothetical protein